MSSLPYFMEKIVFCLEISMFFLKYLLKILYLVSTIKQRCQTFVQVKNLNRIFFNFCPMSINIKYLHIKKFELLYFVFYRFSIQSFSIGFNYYPEIHNFYLKILKSRPYLLEVVFNTFQCHNIFRYNNNTISKLVLKISEKNMTAQTLKKTINHKK